MTTLIDANYDAGVFEGDSQVTNGGNLSVEVAARLADTIEGLQCIISDTTSIYDQFDISVGTTLIRYRFYLDINELTIGAGDTFNCTLLRISGAPYTLHTIGVNYTVGGDYTLMLYYYEDGGGTWETILTPLTDAPHYVEVLVERASGVSANDGEINVWVDGALELTSSGLDIYNNWADINAMWLGAAAIDSGTSGTFYLDELVLNDDGSEIGAVSAGANVPQKMYHYMHH